MALKSIPAWIPAPVVAARVEAVTEGKGLPARTAQLTEAAAEAGALTTMLLALTQAATAALASLSSPTPTHSHPLPASAAA